MIGFEKSQLSMDYFCWRMALRALEDVLATGRRVALAISQRLPFFQPNRWAVMEMEEQFLPIMMNGLRSFDLCEFMEKEQINTIIFESV